MSSAADLDQGQLGANASPQLLAELRKQNRDFVILLRSDSHADHGHFERAKTMGSPVYLAEATASEAIRLFLLGELKLARELNDQATTRLAALEVSLRDAFFGWLAHTTAASLAEAVGDPKASLRETQAAEQVARLGGLGSLASRSLLNLGYLAARRSAPAKALDYYLQVLHTEDLDQLTEAMVNIYLGNLFTAQRQWGLALFYFGDALVNPATISPDVEGITRGKYAEMLARVGELSAAGDALKLARTTMAFRSIHEPELYTSMARVRLIEGDLDEALSLADAGVEKLLSRGASLRIGPLACIQGEVHLARGMPKQALQACEGIDIAALPTSVDQDVLLVQIGAYEQLGEFQKASDAHDRFISLVNRTKLRSMALNNLNGRIFDLMSLQDRHDELVQRGLELAKLQTEVDYLMDQIANDLNGPLTTLRLTFETLQLDLSTEDVVRRVPTALSALHRLKVLVEDISWQTPRPGQHLSDSVRIGAGSSNEALGGTQ